jgi:cytoskeletal protein CcmA (bactofilin family)
MSDPNTQPNNIVIGEGVTFTGTINAPGKAMINGAFTGNLSVSDLHIGKAGQVSGVIRAKEINVHGKLSKDIVCQQHVMIHSTGLVSGTLEYEEMEILRGGQFHGVMKQKSGGA